MEDSLGAVTSREQIVHTVLILVVMEDSLGAEYNPYGYCGIAVVLILVVMEDSLGGGVRSAGGEDFLDVLILVVMEDSLGGNATRIPSRFRSLRLNPCCYGR